MGNQLIFISDVIRKLKTCTTAYIGEPSNDVVPYNLQDSTLLADKLVEVPTETTLERNASKRATQTPEKVVVLRHDQVLKQRREMNSEPPKVIQWLEMKDPATQKVYYHNKMTGKSVWGKPDGFDEAVAIAAEQDANRQTFWIEVQDSKGRCYYYDLVTRETRWDRPTNFEAAPPNQDRRSLRFNNSNSSFDRNSQKLVAQ